MTERWTRIHQLYELALELDDEERVALLERSCGDDPELRRDIEDLLEAEHNGDGFLEPPTRARCPGEDLLNPFCVDSRVGDFRLVTRLGVGGMGEVWEAEQESLGRRVALKLLPPGRMDPKSIEFFAREARAGGRLTHPGIVAVHGAGVDAGVHWIAMELVEGGRTLAHLLEETRDGGELTAGYYRGVAELVAKIADALQAAHDEGVIHRDLKPLNVLLDPRGEPRVGDFGLARVVSEHSLSQTGEFAGSYYYMSPEQVMARRMGIDHRTDIFSLGVVLYELLSLVRPFEGDTTHQIAEKIVMVDPPDPRQLRSRVPRDLAVICAKAMEKRPEHRYPSMTELAADLGRHLADEPILARSPGALRRVAKWVRRNPTPSTAAAMAMASFVAISALAWNLHERGAELEDKTLEAQASAARAEESTRELAFTNEDLEARTLELEARTLELAETNVELESEKLEAEQERDLVRAVNLFLHEDLLGSVAPSAEAGRGRDVTMREVLDATAEKVGGRFAGRPRVEAGIRATLGKTYGALGEYELAEPHLMRALVLSRAALGDDHRDTLVAGSNIAALLFDQGRMAEAEPYHVEALKGLRRVMGDAHPDTLGSINNMAGLLSEQGRLAEAETYYVEALEGLRRVMGDEHPTTLASISGLGILLKDLGKLAEAEPYLIEALEGRRRVLGDEHPDTLHSIYNMGAFLFAKGKLAAAESYFVEALEGRRRVLGDEHSDTLSSIAGTGSLMKSQGKLAEAEPYYVEALERRRRVLGDEHPETLSSINNMGTLLIAQEKLDEAEPYMVEALSGQRRVLGDEHPSTLNTVNNLAALLTHLGKLAEAEPYWVEALEAQRRVLGDAHPRTLNAIGNMGLLLCWQGKFAEAELHLVEALQGRRRVLGDDHPDTLTSVSSMGYLAKLQGELAEAEPYYVEVLERRRRVLGDEHPSTLATLYSLGGLLIDRGRLAQAETLARELVGLASESDPNYPVFEALLDEVLRARSETGDGSNTEEDGR